MCVMKQCSWCDRHSESYAISNYCPFCGHRKTTIYKHIALAMVVVSLLSIALYGMMK